MTVRSRMLAALVFGACLAAVAAAAPAKPTPAAAHAPAPSAAVATVGDLRVDADELDRSVAEALALYRSRNGGPMDSQLEPMVRRQVLENLIRQRLLALEARRRNIIVSDEDAEAELKKDPVFRVGDSYSEARYLALKATHPESYAKSIAAIRTNLASRRASQEMDRETHIDESALRAEVTRELEKASIEYLAVRGNEMDGSYVEPREAEVVAWYRNHTERFRLPEQAVLSIIPVDRPAIADSAGATDAGYRAWEQAMRTRADSARAAIRSGARFDDIASRFGGAKTGQVLSRARAPEPWRGGPRELAAALAATPGTVLPEPVRLASGWGIARVDAVLPTRIAPMTQVAKAIRDTLRGAARRRVEDRDLEEIYRSSRDSLKTDGLRIRYALADTGSFAAPEPTPEEIERFYRAHLADYSSFDRTTSQVVETPLARVREDVRARWMSERRLELARTAADRLLEAWSRGRRDPALEKTMTLVRDPGVVPLSAPPDEGELGKAIVTELAKHSGQTGAFLLHVERGIVVIHVIEVVHGYLPTFEQARPLLLPRLDDYAGVEIDRAARALFDRDSTVFNAPAVLHFTRAIFEPPPLLEVPLTHGEVERYYRAHINDYTVQELVHVRHILISPTGPGAAADAAARQKAEDILKRVRAGEDWLQLVAQYTDDPATKAEGGDVGMFRHGQMREAFERAAFAMRPGDITGPVKTEVGYHILECLEYQPPVLHPLPEVYANAAHDCALVKGKRMANDRADSVLRAVKTVAEAKEAVKRLHLNVIPNDHAIGSLSEYGPELRDYIRELEQVKPGQLYSRTQLYEGLGPVITWVDGITPIRPRPWELARPYVYQYYKIERARAVLAAKRAELDSMLAAGWSVDSLATLWGGLERIPEAQVGGELRGLGGRTLLDSLVFGIHHPPVLETGRLSGWIEFPRGLARIRVSSRAAPDPEQLARRIELRRQVTLWRRLNDYFDRLKARYPVRILDSELRATALPEPSEES